MSKYLKPVVFHSLRTILVSSLVFLVFLIMNHLGDTITGNYIDRPLYLHLVTFIALFIITFFFKFEQLKSDIKTYEKYNEYSGYS